jgi:adenylyltransferase/sulfurtransferase
MLKKYKAQIAIPEIGIIGQKKLLNSSVLIIGLGGLGCPIATQLTAAGIGKIGIVESDIVEETNLARQILYKPSDIGEKKIEIAYKNLKQINPDIEIIKHECFLNEENYQDIIKKYDVIIDCTDNFQTRYLINDACYFLKKPLISGMVFQFEGRMILFNFQKSQTPCFRCLYPIFNNQVQSCSNGGVTNMITGMIGSMQANEAIKFILNINNDRDQTFLIKYDSLNNEFKKIELSKNNECELCSKNNTINKVKKMIINCKQNTNCSIEQLIECISNKKNLIILDVRTPEERIDDGVIPNDIHIQLDYLQNNLDKIEKFKDELIIVYCRSGVRSASAMHFLKDQKFHNVLNLDGGIKAYNLYQKKNK